MIGFASNIQSYHQAFAAKQKQMQMQMQDSEVSVFDAIVPFDDDVNVRLYDTLGAACSHTEQLTWSTALLCCSVDEAVGLLSKQVIQFGDVRDKLCLMSPLGIIHIYIAPREWPRRRFARLVCRVPGVVRRRDWNTRGRVCAGGSAQKPRRRREQAASSDDQGRLFCTARGHER